MIRILLFFFLLVGGAVRAWAFPSYALRYQTPCSTCHSVAPALNRFGLAFQANYFRWPAGQAPEKASGLAAAPVSVIVSGSNTQGQDFRTSTKLRAVELHLSEAGYYVSVVPAGTEEGQQGSLGSAFFALPISGKQGQWATVIGQTTPLMYQYDPVNALTEALPRALSEGINGFSLTDAVPTVRADYFSGRGTASPDGNYLSIGVPFEGVLSLRKEAHLGGENGLYIHAFRREQAASFGVLGYAKSNRSLVSAIGTYQVNERCQLLGVGTTGSAPGERIRSASLEAQQLVATGLALTGRVEWGTFSPYPVAALNYVPPQRSVVRLSVEVSGQRGQRTTAVTTRLQF